MNTVTLALLQVVLATAVEVDSTGTTVPVVPANLTATIDNTAVATVSSNGDGSFTVSAVSAGTATLTVTDTVNNLSGTGAITVTGGGNTDLPVSLSIVFGTPSNRVATTGAPTADFLKAGASVAQFKGAEML